MRTFLLFGSIKRQEVLHEEVTVYRERKCPLSECLIDGGDYTVTDDSIGMVQGLKPLMMNTLLFQGSDYALDHPVLLRAVGRDELLLQAVASDQGCEASTGEDQAIVQSVGGGHLFWAVVDPAFNARPLENL